MMVRPLSNADSPEYPVKPRVESSAEELRGMKVPMKKSTIAMIRTIRRTTWTWLRGEKGGGGEEKEEEGQAEGGGGGGRERVCFGYSCTYMCIATQQLIRLPVCSV